MQDLLAFSFLVASDEASDTFEAIGRRFVKWAWGRTGQPTPELVAPENRLRSDDGYELRWARAEVPDRSERGIELELFHPADDDPGLRWRITTELVLVHDVVRVGIHLSREATDFVLRPAAVELGTPRLVTDLISDYACFAGAFALTPGREVIGPTDVDRLVEMLATPPPDRVLPIVVVAPRDEIPEPNSMATRLVGLAHVVSLSGYLAYKRLQEALPEAFTPPGGLRLYWPGFGLDSDRLRHPYWTAARIRMMDEPIENQLYRLLSRVSVVRVPREPLIPELRDMARTRRREELQAQGEDASASAYDELLTLADEDIAELKKTIAELQKKVEQVPNLEAALATAQVNIRAMQLIGALDGEAEADDDASKLPTPHTWDEFADRLVDLAERTEGALAVTKNAFASARGSAYGSPERMWEILEAMAEAAVAYRRSGAEVGMRMKDWFIDNYGLDFAPHDANLGHLKNFEFEGQVRSREPHIKVDDAKHGVAQTGRVYFELDVDGLRFVVDHIGSKLTLR